MKRSLVVLIAGLALAGCATDGYGYGGGYSAYYDDAYGPFYDGYWGHDGAFWYMDGPRGRGHWHRDEGQHFRRGPAPGANFHGVHGGNHMFRRH
jgi:hypothetical protein